MRWLGFLGAVLLLTACKFGFNPDPGPADAAADAMPDAPIGLGCLPVRHAVGPTSVALAVEPTIEMAAIPTANGYAVFVVDDAGVLHGFTYRFDGTNLVAGISDKQIAADAHSVISAVAVGDDVLLAMPYGRPDWLGTDLIPLDAQLDSRGALVRVPGWFGGAGALARATSGALAFLAVDAAGAVQATPVSPAGAALASGTSPANPSELPDLPTILPTSNGYLVLWKAKAPSPDPVRAAGFAADLTAATSAITVNSGISHDALVPRGAYSPALDTHLFAWAQKPDTGPGDQIWASLRDGKLTQTPTGDLMIAASGNFPVVAAGKNDFLVVWDLGGQLNAARVTKDRTVTPLTITGTGVPLAWDVIVRYGEPALVWLEQGATEANMWFDPLCR